MPDIHGNFDALSALSESYDELWVLGDLVNYGPEPLPVIEYVRSRGLIARGNHDHSIGFDEDPRCSPPFREMAEATRRFTASVLDDSAKEFLRRLPVQLVLTRDNTRFHLCHAIPSDPLYGYCEASSPKWHSEVARVAADVILVGHTDVPAVRRFGGCVVFNPGSLGLPKTDNAQACYAVWMDGEIQLKSFPYDVERTISKIQAMPLAQQVRDDLCTVLRTGQPRSR